MDTFVTKAARLNGPRDIELIERELVCGEDDIIVKNHLMGICGSDKNFYRGYLPPKTAEFRQDPKFPFLLGHESGGTVVAVGSRVADYKVGDKVMAFGWNNNFAEYFAAKSFQLQPVPYGLDMDIASLGEPISCAMYSGLNSGVQLGDTVVVMGGGFAGQIIAQCARRKGAYRVIVVDVLEGKLALARRLGADITLNPGQDDVIEAINGTCPPVFRAESDEPDAKAAPARRFVYVDVIPDAVPRGAMRTSGGGCGFIVGADADTSVWNCLPGYCEYRVLDPLDAPENA